MMCACTSVNISFVCEGTVATLKELKHKREKETREQTPISNRAVQLPCICNSIVTVILN